MTTNPSLEVDNDAERRVQAMDQARGAVYAMGIVYETQLRHLLDENDRLRAALAEANGIRAAWTESEKARAMLAAQYDAAAFAPPPRRARLEALEAAARTAVTLLGAPSGARIDGACEALADALKVGGDDPAPLPPPTPQKPVFVCGTCMDTHRVDRPDGRVVMCTRCPTPCRKCALDSGRGAFCETTPCPCACHAKVGGDS